MFSELWGLLSRPARSLARYRRWRKKAKQLRKDDRFIYD